MDKRFDRSEYVQDKRFDQAPVEPKTSEHKKTTEKLVKLLRKKRP